MHKKYVSMALFAFAATLGSLQAGVKKFWNTTQDRIQAEVVPSNGSRALTVNIDPGQKGHISYPGTYAKEMVFRDLNSNSLETQIQDWHKINENEYFTVEDVYGNGHLTVHAHPNSFVNPVHNRHNYNMVQIHVRNNSPHTAGIGFTNNNDQSKHIVLAPQESKSFHVPAHRPVKVFMKVDGQMQPAVASIPAGRLHQNSTIALDYQKYERQELENSNNNLGQFVHVDGIRLNNAPPAGGGYNPPYHGSWNRHYGHHTLLGG